MLWGKYAPVVKWFAFWHSKTWLFLNVNVEDSSRNLHWVWEFSTEGYFEVCRILGVTSCDKTVVQGGLQNSPAIRVYPKRKLITIYTTVFSLRQKMSLGELLMDHFLYSTIHSVGHGIQHILHDPSPRGLGTISEEIRGRHELLAWLRHRGATKGWWFVGFCAILNWILFPTSEWFNNPATLKLGEQTTCN